MAPRERCDPHPAKVSTKGMEMTEYMCLLPEGCWRYNTPHPLLWLRKVDLGACGHRFGLTFDLNNSDSVWKRARVHNLASKTKIILVALICWNLWHERNNWIFSNTAPTIATCLGLVYFDIISWAGYCSEDTTGVYTDNLQGRTHQIPVITGHTELDQDDCVGLPEVGDGSTLLVGQASGERGDHHRWKHHLLSCFGFYV